MESTEPFFKGSTGRNTRGLLRITILCLIAAAAIASRLFSVIRKYAPSKPLIRFNSPHLVLELCSGEFRDQVDWGYRLLA
jgi:hypothetical protein